MFHHVALIRFVDGVDVDQIAAFDDGLAALPARVSSLRGFRFGRDVGITDGSWDYAVVADFDDEAGYELYRDHPAHVDVLRTLSGPITAAVIRVQFHDAGA